MISATQRVFAQLTGAELAEEDEEASRFEQRTPPPPEISDSDRLPIEAFDIVIVDECHRSIYGSWRQLLEYFDAHVIGLTATPTLQTMGFFQQNLVAEYPYERSVADGVNVQFEVYRIRTQIGEHGSRVEKGYTLPVRDKRTRSASSGGNQPALNKERVAAIEIPIPPLAECRAIVDIVAQARDAQLELRTGLREAFHRAAALRQSILAAAFRGELVA